MSVVTFPLRTGVNGSDVTIANQILSLILQGSLPRCKYDEIQLTKSSNVYTYLFLYEDIEQFYVTVTNPNDDFTVTITEVNNLLLEDASGVILLESGDQLLLEG